MRPYAVFAGPISNYSLEIFQALMCQNHAIINTKLNFKSEQQKYI